VSEREREPDDALLRRWQAGDANAAERLVKRYFAVVFRFFRSKLPAEAEDMTQKTFAACLESASRWRGEGSFRPYLLGIARKQLFASLRRRGRTEKVFDPLAASVHGAVDPGIISPSVGVAAREHDRLLLEALRRIPIDFQITVELFYWEDLTLEEISTVLEVAVGTVKSRLGRARVMLRAQLEVLSADPQAAETTMTNLQHWAGALRDALDRPE
jgi:RNA polymerase sigma factor (sigma-70 family)